MALMVGNRSQEEMIQLQAIQILGPVRDSLGTVLPMTFLYSLLLLTGTLGNICTCIVIARNKYMHTATNFYLFSLAVSDLLLLILGIPQELFMLWQKYPYIAPEFWCVLRGFGSETSTNASILLISAFTVERFFAICNPIKSHTMSQLPRAIKIILIIWVVSALSALPLVFQFGIISLVDQKGLQNISRMCGIKRVLFEYGFETTAIVFFLVPITLISVLYVIIGIHLRRSSNQIKSEPSLAPKEMLTQFHEANHSESVNLYQRNNSVCSSSQQKQIASRRSVIRMLVAVVIAFFVCYSPFHAQRVLASMMNRYSLKSKKIEFYHNLLNHISGVTYYLSASVNPILYQLMSRKFRIAFKDTFGHCLPCARSTLPDITYSNIIGGASSYKLNRTGSFYSNGSFRRSSINFDAVTPTVVRKNDFGESTASLAPLPKSETNAGESGFSAVIQLPQSPAEDASSPQSDECLSQGLKTEKSAFLSVPSFKF